MKFRLGLDVDAQKEYVSQWKINSLRAMEEIMKTATVTIKITEPFEKEIKGSYSDVTHELMHHWVCYGNVQYTMEIDK